MNKRLDLARQALRLLPSKTNPRVKRWQAPDEAQGKASAKYPWFKLVLSPSKVSTKLVEKALRQHVNQIVGKPPQAGRVGDYVTTAEVLDTAERMAEETTRIAPWLKDTTNPEIVTALQETVVKPMWVQTPASKFGGKQGSYVWGFRHPGGKQIQYALDPVQATLLETLSKNGTLAEPWTAEAIPWHEMAHVVDHLLKIDTETEHKRYPTSWKLTPLYKEISRSPFANEIMRRIPRLQYAFNVPIERMAVLTETAVAYPDDFRYLEERLGEPIENLLENIYGNKLPKQPWKKR